MILVIDAYNVLKAEMKSKNISSAQRSQFVNEVVAYAKKKDHTVVIVFDGGGYPWPFVTNLSRGILVYSGYSMTADDYIRAYLPDHKHQALFLASSDHELIRKARQCDVSHIGGYEFFQKVKQALHDTAPVVTTDLVKTTDRANPELDALMQAASHGITTFDETDDNPQKRQPSAARTLSKIERNAQKKIDKL